MECLHGSTRREYVSPEMSFSGMGGLPFEQTWAAARDILASAAVAAMTPQELSAAKDAANAAVNAALVRDHSLRQQGSSYVLADVTGLRLCA